MNRGDAAAATWIFRGDESRRRRGRDVDRPRGAAGPLEARGLALEIDSAGTDAFHVGEQPYPPMQRVARTRGYDLSGQRARRFTPDDFDRFDLILAIGDERTDEDMFEVLQKSPHCFTCTVGCKLSRAPLGFCLALRRRLRF